MHAIQIRLDRGLSGTSYLSELGYPKLWLFFFGSPLTITMATPTEFLKFVDENADAFIQRLADAVAIPRYATCIDILPVNVTDRLYRK